MTRLPPAVAALPLICIAALVLAGGCAAKAVGPAFRPEVVEGGGAVIYVYRPPASFGGHAAVVYLDQEFIGQLAAGQYLARHVEPGERFIRVNAGGEAVRLVHLGAGESAYLEVRSSAFDSSPSIRLPPEEVARERIARTGRAE